MPGSGQLLGKGVDTPRDAAELRPLLPAPRSEHPRAWRGDPACSPRKYKRCARSRRRGAALWGWGLGRGAHPVRRRGRGASRARPNRAVQLDAAFAWVTSGRWCLTACERAARGSQALGPQAPPHARLPQTCTEAHSLTPPPPGSCRRPRGRDHERLPWRLLRVSAGQ